MMIIDPQKFDFRYQGESNACAAFACWHAWRIMRPEAAATSTPIALHRLELLKRYPKAVYSPKKSSSIYGIMNAMMDFRYISGFSRFHGCDMAIVEQKLQQKIPLIAENFVKNDDIVTQNHAVVIIGIQDDLLVVLDSALAIARIRRIKPQAISDFFELQF